MPINYDREKTDLTRRNFLSAWTWGLFAIGNLGILGFFGRFFVPNVKYGPPSKFDIGKAASYPDGAQQTFIDQKVSVIRHANNIGAISLVCQHLGCTVAPSATGYDCPCHGSKYDALGNVTHGPAQIALFWFDVSLTPSGDLQVDKSKIVPTSTYYNAG
jgi:cytochrome b6-f complex iron-sulfur subunit